MTIQQNTDRIQTTHIGSLPRPHRLLDAMKAKYSGKSYDEPAFQHALRDAVTDVIRKQVDCGIDIVTDGEFSKPGFFTYVRERLEGFESRPGAKIKLFEQEVAAFPEYYEQFQAGDDGRSDRLARSGRMRRAGQIPRREAGANRY